MKKLDVLFSDTQKLTIKDLAGLINLNQSQIARAAMQLGLQHIKNATSKNSESGADMVIIEDAKGRR